MGGESSTTKVQCPVQRHNTVPQARARTRTARSGVQYENINSLMLEMLTAKAATKHKELHTKKNYY